MLAEYTEYMINMGSDWFRLHPSLPSPRLLGRRPPFSSRLTLKYLMLGVVDNYVETFKKRSFLKTEANGEIVELRKEERETGIYLGRITEALALPEAKASLEYLVM